MKQHAQSNGRSNSAPVNSIRENHSEKIAAGLYKDSQFTPWSNEKDVNELSQLHPKRLPSKSFSSTSVPTKKHSSRSKPTKWFNHLSNSQKCGAAHYVFQHHMDHTKYIEDYRNMKRDNANKMSDTSLIPNVFQGDLRNFERVQPISFSSRIIDHHPTSTIVDRLEKCTERGNPRALSSPIKTMSGRGFNSVENTHYENKKRVMVTTLPKCEGVFFSCKNASSYELESEHLLQCKKLSELSLSPQLPQPAAHYDSSNHWKPNNSRRRKASSHVQRESNRPTFKRTSTVKYQDCSQIIKKVLGHYDPSHNTVRTGLT